VKLFSLGEVLREIEPHERRPEDSLIVVSNFREAKAAMQLANMVYDGEINRASIDLCKLEAQQECLYGTLFVPRLLDILGSRYRILFFVNQKHIVILDDDEFSMRMIGRIRRQRTHQGATRELFLYNFLAECISTDMPMLHRYERRLMQLEEKILDGKIDGVEQKILPLRRELLTLRVYYDEMMDLGKALEENENHFFAKKQLKYFGTVSDRADRLMSRTVHLLDYAQQVRDAYQTEVDSRQNENMKFLTVLSTIFFPLTLITGWYGMNFENMPELQNGYPGVILFSLLVVAGLIFLCKRKNIF
jgi:magnesium transporter